MRIMNGLVSCQDNVISWLPEIKACAHRLKYFSGHWATCCNDFFQLYYSQETLPLYNIGLFPLYNIEREFSYIIY